MHRNFSHKLSERLKSLRKQRGWTLGHLAELSGVSTATLSRLENGEVSPTTDALGRLCAAYNMSLTRLMAQVEVTFSPVIRRPEQAEWSDPETGFIRRSVSPPAGALAAEILECRLKAGTHLTYERPPVDGQEHYLVMLDGELKLSLDGQEYALKEGDCMRYQLFGASSFKAGDVTGARYLLVLV